MVDVLGHGSVRSQKSWFLVSPPFSYVRWILLRRFFRDLLGSWLDVIWCLFFSFLIFLF
jgi:hypothetical protein